MRKVCFIVTLTIITGILLFIGGVPIFAGEAPLNVEPNALMSIPTADVSRYGDLTIGYSQAGKRTVLGAVCGITDDLEIGISALARDKSSVRFSGSVKASMKDETSRQPALALGLTNDSVYAVASKQLFKSPGLRGHIGFGAGDLNGLFLGLTKILNPVSVSPPGKGWEVPVITFMAEMVRRELNFGARFDFTPDLKVDIGVRGGGELLLGARYTMGF